MIESRFGIRSLDNLYAKIEQQRSLFAFQEHMLAALQDARRDLEVDRDELKALMDDDDLELDELNMRVDDLDAELLDDSATRPYDQVLNERDGATAEYDRLSMKRDDLTAAHADTVERIAQLRTRIAQWRSTIFEQAAASLFANLEVFLRDLLLDNLLDAGWIFVKNKDGKLDTEPKREDTDNGELRDDMIATLNDVGKSFQNSYAVSHLYQRYFSPEAVTWGIAGKVPRMPDYVKPFLRREVMLLCRLRHAIVHADGEAHGNEYKRAYYTCRKNIPAAAWRSKAPTDPIAILDAQSRYDHGVTKMAELFESIAMFAGVFVASVHQVHAADRWSINSGRNLFKRMGLAWTLPQRS